MTRNDTGAAGGSACAPPSLPRPTWPRAPKSRLWRVGVLRTATLAAGTAVAFAVGTAAAQDTRVFGDSLSDDGNIRNYIGVVFPPPPYAGGRFSNGPVWAEYLPGLLGVTLRDEDNVAVGGAFSGRENALNDEAIIRALGVRLPGVLDQVDAFVNTGRRAAAGDLVVVWGGNNDTIALADTLAETPEAARPALLAERSAVVATNLETAVRGLAAAGARRFVVPNLPDLGQVPDEEMRAAGPLATLAAATVNAQVVERMAALSRELGVAIEVVDVSALLRDAVADPARYGFTDVTTPCVDSLECLIGGREVQDGFLFFDDLHPTTRAHALLAQAVAAALAPSVAAPAQMEVARAGQRLTGTALRTRQAARRAGASGMSMVGPMFLVDPARFGQGGGGAGSGGYLERPAPNALDHPFSLFISGTYAWGDRGGGQDRTGFEYDQSMVMIGGDYLFAEGLLAGAAIGFGRGHAGLSGGAGELSQDSFTGSLYGSWFGDLWYVDVAGTAGRDRYDPIRRRTFIPGLTAEGRTAGWTVAAQAEAGLGLPAGPLRLGPFTGVRWSRTTIDGYDEEGALFLNRRSDAQEDVSRTAFVGVQGEAVFRVGAMTLAPRLRAAVEREFGDGDRIVGSRPVGTAALPVVATAPGTDRTLGRLSAGLDLRFRESLSVLFEGETVVGQDDGRAKAVTVRMRYRF
ncbi:MAG TPA: autotransporter domain-containing protein [Azospirillaceae bacterium]|nr:autotransporter domain-containing protein [Azospirillaceae bacterium]